MFKILSFQGNANPNNPKNPPHTNQNGWIKILIDSRCWQDTEKVEHSSTVGGILNWYNQSENQSIGWS